MKYEPNHIYNMDCLEGLAGLEDQSVDLIVTDPPFAIDFKAARANYNRTAGRVLEGYREIHVEDYQEFTHAWMRQCFRALKETGSAFVFSGWNNLKALLIAADDAGFHTVNHIIWKYQFGVVCKCRFVTSHYHCLFLCRDEKKRKFFQNCRHQGSERAPDGGSMRYRDMEDVWIIPREYWHGDQKTPTKLPSAVLEKILAYTSEPGDLVLDPFLGSGQTAVVSKRMERRWIGFEIVPDYYNFANMRLEKNLYRIGEPDGEAAPEPGSW